MPPKKKLRPLTDRQATIVSLIVDWRSTPTPLRKHQTLADLARAHGFRPSDKFYKLASSAEVYHEMLMGQAGKALADVPDILETVAAKAKDGSARHAEIYLNFVRQFFTDAKLLEQRRPMADLDETLTHLTASIDKINEFADSLGATEHRAIEAEDTDYEDEEEEAPPVRARRSDEPVIGEDGLPTTLLPFTPYTKPNEHPVPVPEIPVNLEDVGELVEE